MAVRGACKAEWLKDSRQQQTERSEAAKQFRHEVKGCWISMHVWLMNSDSGREVIKQSGKALSSRSMHLREHSNMGV